MEMRQGFGRKLPGTHAVRILLGATFIAGVASVIFARTADSSPQDDTPTEQAAAVSQPETAATHTATASPTQETFTDEGAVLEPAPEQLPGTEISTASTSRFSMPLKAWSKVTDRYGARNRGPGFIHGGIDMGLEGLNGSNVYAACSGTVSETAYSGSYGNHVFVDCGEGWSTLYAHLSKILLGPGDRVNADVVIGISGSTS